MRFCKILNRLFCSDSRFFRADILFSKIYYSNFIYIIIVNQKRIQPLSAVSSFIFNLFSYLINQNKKRFGICRHIYRWENLNYQSPYWLQQNDCECSWQKNWAYCNKIYINNFVFIYTLVSVHIITFVSTFLSTYIKAKKKKCFQPFSFM